MENGLLQFEENMVWESSGGGIVAVAASILAAQSLLGFNSDRMFELTAHDTRKSVEKVSDTKTEILYDFRTVTENTVLEVADHN